MSADIELAEFISNLRAELETALAASSDAQVRFIPKTLDLELSVVAEKSAEASALDGLADVELCSCRRREDWPSLLGWSSIFSEPLSPSEACCLALSRMAFALPLLEAP